MLSKAFKYLNISDIHLGHMKNPTESIVRNLMNYFTENIKLFSTLDMIIINGDIYERLLPTSSKDSILAIEFLCNLARFCQKYDIMLRINNGTPSHDANQIDMFTKVLKTLDVSIDYKFMKDISIEYLEKFNLNLLYIPDEIRESPLITYEDVLKLMAEKDLTKVDIAFIHGQFHFQIPNVILDSSHNEEDYLNIVNHYIHVGHIHKPLVFKRIIGNGSFDRLTHGEEEKKGGVVVFLNPNSDDSYIFIENKNAMMFKTIYITTLDMVEALEQIKTSITNVPLGHHIRLSFEANNPLIENYTLFKNKLDNFQVTLHKKDKKERKLILERVTIKQFQIDSTNIEKLWKEEVKLPTGTEEIFKEEMDGLLI